MDNGLLKPWINEVTKISIMFFSYRRFCQLMIDECPYDLLKGIVYGFVLVFESYFFYLNPN